MREPISGLLKEQELALFQDHYLSTMLKADVDHENFQKITQTYFFRKIPQGSYVVTAGLEQVIHFVKNLKFSEEDLEQLKKTSGKDFNDKAIDYMRKYRFKGDIYAVPEGTPVFPHEPIIHVTGCSPDNKIIETYLLNQMNTQSLFATKSARIVNTAKGKAVIDFGARRAHGIDAAMKVARASYIAGFTGTSLVAAGIKWGIPYTGTMAHVFIQERGSERQAFEEYAESEPHNPIFLIDTYGTPNGTRNAIEVGIKLKKMGLELKGVRLDSGKFLELSFKVRQMLDEAGLNTTKIVASGDLDEFVIEDLVKAGAPIDVYGVGTRLATGASYNSRTKQGGVPVLNGIYKYVEKYDASGRAIPDIKVSDDPYKTTFPGRQKVYRVIEDNRYVEDHVVLWDENCEVENSRSLLVPIILNGQQVYNFPTIHEIKISR